MYILKLESVHGDFKTLSWDIETEEIANSIKRNLCLISPDPGSALVLDLNYTILFIPAQILEMCTVQLIKK